RPAIDEILRLRVERPRAVPGDALMDEAALTQSVVEVRQVAGAVEHRDPPARRSVGEQLVDVVQDRRVAEFDHRGAHAREAFTLQDAIRLREERTDGPLEPSGERRVAD